MTLLPNLVWTPVAVLLGFFALARCEELELLMPPYEVHENDTYLCFATELPHTSNRIVAIEPRSDMEVAHHMLLFGCSEPEHQPTAGVWECHMARPCKVQENILYGWGRNAPKLTFPEGVGYSIGGTSSIKYLVLQVHYLSTRPERDASGVVLTLSKEPAPMTTSMMAYVVGFSIPPGKESHLVDNTCCLTGFQPVTTMAFRVHTHAMGRSVYMVRTSGLAPNGTEVARNDPQLPQGFYPVGKEVSVRPGERLKVTCDFNSVGKDHDVVSGHTHDDEMCNMYMMTYSEIPHFVTCSGDYNVESLDGPGGISKENSLVPESSLLNAWKPPGERNSTTKETKMDSVGQVPGVAVAEDGSIWILHRGDASFTATSFDANDVFASNSTIDEDVVMELDPKTGAVKRKWGKGLFYMPHMITVDFDGNIWITDVGRHQALKFDKSGQLIMELGEKMVPGNDESHFCKPTQVQILNDGRILVSDGYCNSRVVIFSKDGKYMGAIEDENILVAHSIAVDECENQVFVASRENSLLMAYDFNTKQKIGNVSMEAYGKLWSLTKGPYETIAALCWEKGQPAHLLLLDANVQMLWEIPDVDWPHDIALGAAPMEVTGAQIRLFAFYVAETRHDGTSGIRKFISTPKNFSPETASEESTIMVSSRNKKPEDLEGDPPKTGNLKDDKQEQHSNGPTGSPESSETKENSQARQSDEGHAAAKQAVSESNQRNREVDVDEDISSNDVDNGPPAVRSHVSQSSSVGKDQATERLDSHEIQTNPDDTPSASSGSGSSTDVTTASTSMDTSSSGATSVSAGDMKSSRSDPNTLQSSTKTFTDTSTEREKPIYEITFREGNYSPTHMEPRITPSGFSAKGLMMISFPVCALAAGYHYLKRRRGRRYQRLF